MINKDENYIRSVEISTLEVQREIIRQQQEEIERLKKLVEQSNNIAEKAINIADRCSLFLTLLTQSGLIDPIVKKEIFTFLNSK